MLALERIDFLITEIEKQETLIMSADKNVANVLVCIADGSEGINPRIYQTNKIENVFHKIDLEAVTIIDVLRRTKRVNVGCLFFHNITIQIDALM